MNYDTSKFVSPEPLYARIKEEMKTYFNTGQIDDLMFPVWTKDCIKKFKNTHLQQRVAVLDLFNYKAELPCDFRSMREVFICATYSKGPIKSPFTFYYQTDCRIGPQVESCSECDKPECTPDYESPVPFVGNVPQQFRITHKVNYHMDFTFTLKGLLKPGNLKTVRVCEADSPNLGANCMDTFDIINGSLVTSFPTGTVYITYYADPEMDNGYTEIPDAHEFHMYIYRYIRFMIYQQLYEQSADETINALKTKKDEAERMLGEQYILARNDAMGETAFDVQQAIKRSYNKHNKYRLK